MLKKKKNFQQEWLTLRKSRKHFPEGKNSLVSGEGFSDRWKGLEMVKSHSVLGEPVFLQYKVQEEKM